VAAWAQSKTPADFGYRHLTMRYQRDTVDILVLSKKGEELQRKPMFFYAGLTTQTRHPVRRAGRVSHAAF
jgi:hypothetical protein